MLNNFFRINMPYGIRRGPEGSWSAFNRDKMPLGWNHYLHGNEPSSLYTEYPIYVKYRFRPEAFVKKYDLYFKRDEENNISIIFFYNDGNIPCNNSSKLYWDRYFDIIKDLSIKKVKKVIEPIK